MASSWGGRDYLNELAQVEGMGSKGSMAEKARKSKGQILYSGLWSLVLLPLTPLSWIGLAFVTLFRWLVKLQVLFFLFGVGLALPIAFFLVPFLPALIDNYQPPIFGGWWGVWGLGVSLAFVACLAYLAGFAELGFLVLYAAVSAVVIVAGYEDGKGWGPYLVALMLVWPPLLIVEQRIPRPWHLYKEASERPSVRGVRVGMLWHAAMGVTVSVVVALVWVTVQPKQHSGLESVVFRVVSPAEAERFSFWLMRWVPPEWRIAIIDAIRDDRTALAELRPLANMQALYKARDRSVQRLHQILLTIPRSQRVMALRHFANEGHCVAESLLWNLWFERRSRHDAAPEMKHCPQDEKTRIGLRQEIKYEFDRLQDFRRVDF